MELKEVRARVGSARVGGQTATGGGGSIPRPHCWPCTPPASYHTLATGLHPKFALFVPEARINRLCCSNLMRHVIRPELSGDVSRILAVHSGI